MEDTNMNNTRRRSSTSSLDKQKLARLQQLKVFQQGGLGSKIFKVKAVVAPDESAASALSKVMTRKKAGEVLSLQIEIENETQWKILLRREGLIVVEVYTGWTGPCVSMVSLLKKVKVDTNDDRLTLALANSDNISDLSAFKNQSEPAWIFFGGGKPVRLMKGTNAAKLIAAIKSEFIHELLCMEGKAKRNLISINDETDRRKTAEKEAMQLALEDKKRSIILSEEKTIKSHSEDPVRTDEVKGTCRLEQEVPIELIREKNITEDLNDPLCNEQRTDPNMQLKQALEKYTVIALQNYLLETGAVTEIKDLLKDEFKIVQERYIFLQEDGVRRLFGIPHHIEIPIEEEEPIVELEEPDGCEEGQNEIDIDAGFEGASGESMTDSIPKPTNVDHQHGDIPSRPNSRTEHVRDSEEREINTEDHDEESTSEVIVEEEKVPKFEIIPIPLPDELEGDTLLFLLESSEIKKLLGQQSDQTCLQTADDFIKVKVGPEDFTEAKENAPNSLHALYGREEHAMGVWCPRKYDDKRYVMLNFFPQFVTEMLVPPPKECPKYIVAIFPALFANEIMENPELMNNRKYIIAQGKVNIAPKVMDRLLKSKGHSGEDLEMQKKALTGFDMFAVSVDEKNPTVAAILASLEPIHMSVDNENGKYETAKLFPHLEVLIDDDPSEDEEEHFYKDLVVEKFFGGSRSKLKLDAILDEESYSNTEDIQAPSVTGGEDSANNILGPISNTSQDTN